MTDPVVDTVMAAVYEQFGGKRKFTLCSALANCWIVAEWKTGKSVWEDQETRDLAKLLMNVILDLVEPPWPPAGEEA